MFENIKNSLKNTVRSPLFTLVVTYIVLFSIIICRMFYLQIINEEEYANEAAVKSNRIRSIKSARGCIYDKNGVLLAGNEQSYSVTMEDTGDLKNNIDKNTMILKCVNLIKKNGDKIDLEFPIRITKKGKKVYKVEKNAELRFKRDIFFKKSVDELDEEQENMTATQVFDYLRNTDEPNTTRFFSPEAKDEVTGELLEPDYSDEEALMIMTVRYALLMKTYSKYEPITISSGVNERTVAAIKENTADLPGVEIETEFKRVYYDSKYFSHIIGYTGLISSETLEQTRQSDNPDEYTASDQIGKSGIEKEYEQVLKGVKGKENLVLDSSSRILEQDRVNDPVPGNDVYLSIDSDLQKAIYTLAAKEVAGILLSKLTDSRSHGTRGRQASGILVSIYDVYDAIIQNDIIDVTDFSSDKATKLEKRIYTRFTDTKKRALEKIAEQLKYDNTKPMRKLTKAMQVYFKHIYSMLRDNNVLDAKSIDTTSDIYRKYQLNEISLSEFIVYAIKNNWVNLENLDIDANYYSSEEVFDKLCSYTLEELLDDFDFDKCVYHVMVDEGSITGTEICLLLFDQGVLKEDPDAYAEIEAGMVSAYSFIREKIRSMEIEAGDLGLTPCSCSAVVTDIKTGKVLSMVSYPSYDNNKFANSVDSEYYSKISKSSSFALMNRATQQKTAPGSTFKMITATAVLEEGYIDPYAKVKDKVTFDKINKPWPNCWSSVGHGNINVTQAIQHSCNYFFYEMGYRLGDGHENIVDNEKGLNILKKYASLYGLTSASGVEVSEAEPSFSDVDVVRSSIGQGTNLYTPSQLSRYVTTLANGNKCFDLTLVDRVHNTINDKFKKNSANIKSEVSLALATTNAIKSGMRKVVEAGSISSLFEKLPIHVAGKTGTAQITNNEPNHALFVSYAPYENPEITVTVQIPNGYTSGNAAELASNIYRYYYEKTSRRELLNKDVTLPALSTDVRD